MFSADPGGPPDERRSQAALGTALHMIAAGLAQGHSALGDMEILLWADRHVTKSSDPMVAQRDLTCLLTHLAAGLLVQAAQSNGHDPIEYVPALREQATKMLEGAQLP